MAERKDGDTEQRPYRFVPAIVRHADGARHHAEAGRTDHRREHIAVAHHAAAQRDDTEQHGEAQAHLVNARIEQPAGRGGEREQHRTGDAVDRAQPRKPDRESIEPRFHPAESGGMGMGMCRHCGRYVAQVVAGYNITSRIFVGCYK